MTQCDFDFSKPKDNSELETFIHFLLRKGDQWITAKEISRVLEFSERKIRDLASASGGRILSGPGCPGYRHIQWSKFSDASEVSKRMRSQAKAMWRRSIEIERMAHTLIHKQ
jgi:hypothetical protein